MIRTLLASLAPAALAAAVATTFPAAPAAAQEAGAMPEGLSPATMEWAETVDFAANVPPAAPMDAEAERAFFRNIMVEWYQTWTPGPTERFDIAVPGAFYMAGDKFFGFDVFPHPEGAPNAAFASWDEYERLLPVIVGGMAELYNRPDPETFLHERVGDVAWMSIEGTASGVTAEGDDVVIPLRTSLVLRLHDGAWRIAHEHVSTPLGG